MCRLRTIGLSSITKPAGGKRSPTPSKIVRSGSLGHVSVLMPGQQVLHAPRQKDKFVPLEFGIQEDELSVLEDYREPSTDPSSSRGRISLYCIADSFDRKKLEELLRLTYSANTVHSYPDCFYVDFVKSTDDEPGSDVFFFDYGVVACWGMTKNQELTVVNGIGAQVLEDPLEQGYEIDEFEFNFSTTEKPHVNNDTVTLNKKFVKDHQMKLAISYAMSQSTKLSVYENNVVSIISETKHLPHSLAKHGEVSISSHEIAMLMGEVFLQKSSVNLLSPVLDTPEFFWRAPDAFATLYKRVIEYLELGERVELLNSRFTVLQEMLDMLRDHQTNIHGVRLEWIVIWLIAVELLVGLLEVLALFGVIGHEK
ncbi:hypothetical protein CEUSTIGMA_g3887.t1 [Chlamydomonas eustigma]|uniref:DUF155 domain-containing protein n=1 Tax=Chlamydomonas eustigma TaxID=1157962 RepID=A0A250X0M1_9CHLO|nr:hypothetical protein CEUSTIGMA_g3887.t1 [Chlamydomonas eustigma]|eukprot:GAX76442.1 hypothetical protein CEUSTIGMA_g3887.t1 [Chlamydomonas eustigma]